MTNWFGTLKRNRFLKLLSLLLALALWFAVSGEERTETSLNMTLEMVNLHKNLMVTSEVPPAIQVRVVGSRSIINSLSQARLIQTLDLSGYKSGRHTFSLGPNSLSLPRGVQVVRIQPNPISLTLASTLTRTLPVKPALENSPAEGYELVSANTRPDQVTVRGPYQELADLKFIPTLPIDLSFLKENTVIATDLDFKNLHLALKDPVPILADIKIGPKDLTRTFPGIPVLTDPQAAKVSPAQIALTLKGLWPLVHNLKPEDLKPRVDIRNLSPGHHRLNVSLDLPVGVSLVRALPATVTVTVPKSP
ncbi:MAG: YbbR-like domain-containing protein [Desulfobaccales bacterium]